MAKKVVFISPPEAEKWYAISNIFARSLLSCREAVTAFNELPTRSREEIKKRFSEFDKNRNVITRYESTEDERKHHFNISLFVDAHVAAVEYDTDPVVVLMCISPPCRLSQKVYVK